jgi:hypothetical protein
MNQFDRRKFGLPTYFKTVGIILIAITALFLVGTKLMYGDITREFGEHNKQLMKLLATDVFIIALLLIVGSREKEENERLFKYRASVAIAAFSTGVMMALIRPLLDFMYEDYEEVYSASEMIIFMLLFYLLVFYTSKSKVMKGDDNNQV